MQIYINTLSTELTSGLFSPPPADKNHVVYMDNFFTSVRLVEDLEVNKIFCVGTIRTNKLKATSELLNKGTLQTMERGDYVSDQGECGSDSLEG